MTITPRDFIRLFLDFIGRFDWAVMLDGNNDVITRIGNDVPGLEQHQVLYAIKAFDDDIRALLTAPPRAH